MSKYSPEIVNLMLRIKELEALIPNVLFPSSNRITKEQLELEMEANQESFKASDDSVGAYEMWVAGLVENWHMRQPVERLKPDSTGVAVVDPNYYWQPMDTCPLAHKVQLRGGGGVAVYSSYDGKSKWWTGWAPLPVERKE
jgi:hypothetical protein